MTPELKPCPFCGGQAAYCQDVDPAEPHNCHHVVCTGCGLDADFSRQIDNDCDTVDQLRTACADRWNRRAPPEATECRDCDQLMTERDSYHDTADQLANGIAAYLGIDIGEHSSGNFPWENAIEAIEAEDFNKMSGVTSPPHEPAEATGIYESGWVIEGMWSSTASPEYWVGSSAWSSDPYKALRFASKQSAQQAADMMLVGINHRIACHEVFSGSTNND